MAENPRTPLTDTTIYRVTNSISRWFAVSMLWLLCSLPIVTMGAATTAAMSAFLKPEGGSLQDLVRGYFCSFRKWFSQATALWLLTLAALALLALDAAFYRQMMKGLPWLLPAAAVILGNLLLGLFRFGCFVMVSRERTGLKALLTQAAGMMVLCLPVWAVMVALDMAVVATLMRIPYLWVCLVILPGLYANMHCGLTQSFLRRFETEQT